MFNFGFLLDGASDSGSNTNTNSWSSAVVWIVMIALIVGVWILMSRKQKKQAQEEQKMRDELAVGDEVTTIGGIIGKVSSIKGDTFVLETTKDKTKIRFLKGAIRSIDVKIADAAAQIMEANAEAAKPETEAEATALPEESDTNENA